MYTTYKHSVTTSQKTQRLRHKDPELSAYCFLSEEWNPVRNNPYHVHLDAPLRHAHPLPAPSVGVFSRRLVKLKFVRSVGTLSGHLALTWIEILTEDSQGLLT